MNMPLSRSVHSTPEAVISEDVNPIGWAQIGSHGRWAFETLQHIPYNVFAQDLAGRILMANRALASSYGYSNACDLIGKTDLDLFPAETVAALRTIDVRVLETGKPILDQEQAIVYADGRRQWIRASRIPLYDDIGSIIGIACTVKDITDSKDSEDLLLAQAHLLDMVAQSAPLAEICGKIVAVVEEHLPAITGAIQLFSPDGKRLMEPIAPTLANAMQRCPDAMAGFLTGVALSAIEAGKPVIIPDIHGDPAFYAALTTLSKWKIRAVWSIPIFSMEGKPLGALSLLSRSVATPTPAQSDLIAMASHMVSAAIERQESAERTAFLASHDALTGLPNRMMLTKLLCAAMEVARESGRRIALAFFDLDNFKLINDSLGHAAGDALLKTVAERARGSLREGDAVARLGGDEFIMFLSDLPIQSKLSDQRFQLIREAISAPTQIDGRMLQVTCSMGVAYFPEHADTLEDLICNADVAMYRAKQFGRDNIQTFVSDMQNVAADRLSLISGMRDAVARNEFTLHYQPQVDLVTNHVFAAEALIRWNHPELGLLNPSDFISVAEETGLIIGIGDWVLNAACSQNKTWQEEGFPEIGVSVNVSARQFRGPNLVAQVAAALKASGLHPRHLELELTESLVMQEGAAAKMWELKALGVKLAIDDFGTGHSSLSALKHFPVNRLKIDRSFVQDISKDEKDQAITGAIVAMAKKLGMTVIAEGVETSEQLRSIKQLACKEAQGYYFSKPLPSSDFKKLLGDVNRPSRSPVARRAVDGFVSDQRVC